MVELVPQHGPGSKHTRPIVLQPWQRALVQLHATEFVRGCLESDGCRHRRIVNGKDYPAYSFSNASRDILDLFVWACGELGIRAGQSNAVTISIAHRNDVATLDQLFARPAFQPWGWLAGDRAFLGRIAPGKVS